MKDKNKSRYGSRYLALMIAFLVLVIATLGYLLMRQSRASIISLMQTRMLDISNTAAAMLNGDDLKSVTPADEGTDRYEAIMRTLTYFQDNIQLKYIYCIRDMGDGTFTFGLDPTVEDPGEFGSPIVYTDALHKASLGTATADDQSYEDAWGKFYSAYSPVFDAQGRVAGIVAVDFSAEWYNQQLATLTWTAVVVALLALLGGAAIVTAIITRSEKRIVSIHGQLNELTHSLMQEIGSAHQNPEADSPSPRPHDKNPASIDDLEQQIQSMGTELKTHIAQVHVRAYQDSLTGVKSKHAYLEAEKALNSNLNNGTLSELAIVVCDVNGLKKINDTLGHKAGDEYIRKASKMICEIFSHSPVYRIGGDEFVMLLTGRDYESREDLMRELHRLSSNNIGKEGAIVSGGLADLDPSQDQSIQDVFERADARMYEEKKLLKSMGAVMRDDESDRSKTDDELSDLLSIKMRKHILIAEDLEMNREILGDLLRDDYDIYYASDGFETMEMLRLHKDDIALLLLDLYMPKMSGREVMTAMQVDEELMSIPVIVLTIDQKAELDSLKIGAMDFIPKPYPDIEIIKARISKCIELSEKRDLIRHTQRDRLTELFNIDYFIRYIKIFDRQHRDSSIDVVACDVNQFHSVNERYGRQFGDLVLRSIGHTMRRLARKTGGLGCRQGGDTFLLYCPHQEHYDQLLQKFLADVFVEKETAHKVSLRFGVFEHAERERDIEKRLEFAIKAADSAQEYPDKLYCLYDYETGSSDPR